MRTLTASVLALAITVLAPASASAITSVGASAGVMTITGDTGRDILTIKPTATAGEYEVQRLTVVGDITASAGCSVFSAPLKIVRCANITANIVANLNDGADQIRANLVTLPMFVDAGVGDDFIEAGSGSDQIQGGIGSDTASYQSFSAPFTADLNLNGGQVTGGGQTDMVPNVENLITGSGNDTLTGNGGDNALFGYDGTNTVSGLGGNDVVISLAGTLDGGAGTDIISTLGLGDAATFDLRPGGGSGSVMTVGSTATFANIEVIDGGDESDTYLSGPGSDLIVESGNGFGVDTLSYAGRVQPVIVTAKPGGGGGGVGESDQLGGEGAIEVLIGGSAGDTLDGLRVEGGPGNDTLFGRNAFGDAGDDTFLLGLVGGQSASGGTGIDTLNLSGATDAVDVDLGSGTLTNPGTGAQSTLSRIENASTGSGDDSLTGGAGPNVLDGGAGDDVFATRDSGADTVTCGLGFDVATVDAADLLTGCETVDTSGATVVTGAAGPTGAVGAVGATGPGVAGPAGPSGAAGTPSTPPTSSSVDAPLVRLPTRVTLRQLIRGVSARVSGARPGSVITIRVRRGSKVLATIRGKASTTGTRILRVKLSATTARSLRRGTKLVVTTTVVGAAGRSVARRSPITIR